MLSFTLAQINPIVGDLAYNRDIILNIWREAKTDLVIFPELVVSGYPPEDLVLKPAFLDGVAAIIEELRKASAHFSAAAIIPCPWVQDKKVYNALHVIGGGRFLHTQFKHHLPNYGVFDEHRVFAAGPLPQIYDFKGTKIGLMICEDMWHANVAAHLKSQGAEILVVPNGSPFEIRKDDTRHDIARARARESALPLVYVNQVGGQDELVFDGASFMMNEQGVIIKELPEFEEAIFDCHAEALALKEPDSSISTTFQNDSKKLYDALCLGLKDYIRKNKFKGVLLGLSGGIDSALSAAIAADTLGADRVRCVMMPSRFTSQDSLDDSAQMAENLGCPYEIISIEGPFKALEATIPLAGLAHENTQSRLRGLILMALSNTSGHMVLSTGNKSEMAVGYATLYGDMNGGFNVLKDVYKTQVYELARWRNAQSPVIPKRILTKAPTAELKADQKDQDSLPPYDALDNILQCLIEYEMPNEDIVQRGHDLETVLRVWNMLDRAEYKRRQACPGVKTTSRAFGRDRRYPITNKFKPQMNTNKH